MSYLIAHRFELGLDGGRGGCRGSRRRLADVERQRRAEAEDEREVVTPEIERSGQRAERSIHLPGRAGPGELGEERQRPFHRRGDLA